jgi:transposase InsO family protein
VSGCHSIPPGEPWRNGYVESFNSRIRDECLNINIFWSLAQARVVISDWTEDDNHRRRHSSLGYQAPAAYQPPAPTGDRRSSTRSAVRSDWVLAGVRESWREFAAGAERG